MDASQALLKATLTKPESELNLGECALAIAASNYPDLDVPRYLGRLDDLAGGVAERLGTSRSLSDVVQAVNEYLFRVVGFRGNATDYGDPRNSFLNEVLDRRLGIPISLSVVYIELGLRLGVDTRGLSFPGHFLVRAGEDDEIVVVDPFFAGVTLGEDELVQRIARFVKDQENARRYLFHLLAGAPKTEIVARMLRNLRETYTQKGELERALQFADQTVWVTPNDPHSIRDRGQLYDKLGVAYAALTDYRSYLDLLPSAADESHIRERMIALAAHGRRLN